MSRILKTKLIILSLVFPLSFFISGILIGENSYLLGLSFHNKTATILLGLAGLLMGIVLDIICYYRKIFALAMYQTPIPLSLFFIFWWISNSLVNNWLALAIGLTGLLLGLWLNNILVLPFQFFKVRKRVLALLYLFYSILVLGLFMGIPLLNLLLGILAGNYLAIRILSYVRNEKRIHRHIHQGALFSAFILFVISTISGLLALSDPSSYMEVFANITHLQLDTEKFIWFLVIAGAIGVILQYYITWFTAYTMLELHKDRKYS